MVTALCGLPQKMMQDMEFVGMGKNYGTPIVMLTFYIMVK